MISHRETTQDMGDEGITRLKQTWDDVKIYSTSNIPIELQIVPDSPIDPTFKHGHSGKFFDLLCRSRLTANFGDIFIVEMGQLMPCTKHRNIGRFRRIRIFRGRKKVEVAPILRSNFTVRGEVLISASSILRWETSRVKNLINLLFEIISIDDRSLQRLSPPKEIFSKQRSSSDDKIILHA